MNTVARWLGIDDARWLGVTQRSLPTGAVVAVFGRAEDTEVIIASAADGTENGRVIVPIGPEVPPLSVDVAGIHLGPHLVTYTGTLQ